MYTHLRKEVMLLLAIKTASLARVWSLFFLPVHHMHVDSHVTGEHLGLTAQETRHD